MVMKTPGVYIVEKSAFPSSVVEVATAVPAFIGYTEKADNRGRSLANRPWRITSLAEYRTYFGGAPKPVFTLAPQASARVPTGRRGSVPTAAAPEVAAFSFRGTSYALTPANAEYLLYYSMQLFFDNGGGPCFIVSVGTYGEDIERANLESGIVPLIKEQEPTMVVIPEAVRLSGEDCIGVQQSMLAHCGSTMKNRFAILDVYNGFRGRDVDPDCIDSFRSSLGVNFLDFAAAYYPWLNTTIVPETEVGFENISDGTKPLLQELLRQELGLPADGQVPDGRAGQQAEAVNDIGKDWSPPIDEGATSPTPEQIEENEAAKALLNKILKAMSPQLLRSVMTEIRDKLNLLPPSAAIAGVYTMVDNTRGVWKAPANVSLNSVRTPAVNITHDEQEDLNVTVQGKSINAIRPFIGEGVLVWGGRTLDGNSLDWRYVQVRRTIIMLEESVKLAAKAYVFENNVANTWVTIKSTIRNFLTGIWKRGGLQGAIADDAFKVFVGLGETMTPEDVLEGILRVTVLVALIRPAEFIEITFQQQMPQS